MEDVDDTSDRSELYWAFGGYSVIMLCISIYIFTHRDKIEEEDLRISLSQRPANELEQHFLGGRSTPVFLLFLTTFSTIFSGYTMVGVPQEAYKSGFTALQWVAFIIQIGLSFAILTPRLRTLVELRRYSSPLDFITDRYHSNSLRLCMLAAIWLADLIYVAGQFAAINKLVETVTLGKISGTAGCITLGSLILLLEFLGGLKAVMYTDAIQSILMVSSLIIVPFVIYHLYGSFSDLLQSEDCAFTKPGKCGLDEQADQFKQYPETLTTLKLFSLTLSFLSYSVLPQCIQRIYAAKASSSIKITIMSVTSVCFLTMAPGIFIGIICAARFNGFPGTAFAIISGQMYDNGGFAKFMSCIMMCGALAAISSTADSALIAMSQLISEDFYKKTLKPDASPKQVMIVSEVHSFLVVAVGVLIGTAKNFQVSSAVKLQIGIQILAFPPYIWGLFPDCFTGTPSTRSQVYGFIVGLITTVAMQTYISVDEVALPLDAGMWALLVNLIVVACMETFCDAAYLDDDKRTYDLPPEHTLSHLVRKKLPPAPATSTTTQAADDEHATSSMGIGINASKDSNSSSTSNLQNLDKNNASYDHVRLSTEYLSGVAALNMNEPFANLAHSEPWEWGNPFATSAAPPALTPAVVPEEGKRPFISNRAKYMLTMMVLFIFMPWYHPGTEAVFKGGWPVWALIWSGGMVVSAISTMMLIYGWRTPPEVSNKHRLLVDTITKIREKKGRVGGIEGAAVGVAINSPMQSELGNDL